MKVRTLKSIQKLKIVNFVVRNTLVQLKKKNCNPITETKSMDTILVPPSGKLQTVRAMELANLVQQAYEQYNAHQTNNDWKPEKTGKLTGSTTFDLSTEGRVDYDILTTFNATEFNLFDPQTLRLFESKNSLTVLGERIWAIWFTNMWVSRFTLRTRRVISQATTTCFTPTEKPCFSVVIRK